MVKTQHELPRYMVDKVDYGFKIWDTVEHTFTDDGEAMDDGEIGPYRHKDTAIERSKELNKGG